MPLQEDEELLLSARSFHVVRKVLVGPDRKEHVRQIIRHPGAAVILPLLDDGRVVLIRNYRIAVDDWVLELPAGTLDHDEDPLAAAHRELAEETGYRADHMELLISFLSSPGILDERMYLYVATGLRPGPMNLQGGEEIEPVAVPWHEALHMACQGRISDAKTLIGILYYELFRLQPRRA